MSFFRQNKTGTWMFCIFAFCSCKTINTNTSSESKAVVEPPPADLQCNPNEEPNYFTLKKVDFEVSKEMLGIQEGISLFTASSIRNIRLDFCRSDESDELVFKRMYRIHVAPRIGTLVTGINVDPGVDMSQVRSIIFNDKNVENIDLTIKGTYFNSEASAKFKIKSKKTDKGNILYEYKLLGQTDEPDSYYGVTYGTLVYGDIPTNDICPFGTAMKESGEKLQVGTAVFFFKYCAQRMGNGGISYTIYSMTIKDDNEQLPPDARKEITLNKDEIEKYLKIKTGHHNTCDAFSLELPHATYGVTSMTGTNMLDCAEFHAAPGQPNYNERTMKYRVKYGDNEWQKGEILQPCKHFFCPLPGVDEVWFKKGDTLLKKGDTLLISYYIYESLMLQPQYLGRNK